MKTNNLKGLIKGYALLAALVLCGLTAQGQTANGYIIYYDGNFLSHDTSSGAVATTAVNSFNLNSCLWSVSGSYLRPVSSDGSTVLGGLYLRPRSNNTTYSLNTNTSTNYADWNGLSDGSRPYYGNTYYIQLNGTTWRMRNSTSNRGYLYAVTKSSSDEQVAEVYSGAINGTTAFFTAGATATYTPTATHTDAYTITTYTYSYSGGTLATTTSSTVPTPTNVNLSDGWTLTWSLSDDTYATINSSGMLTVKNTLPTTYASTNVQLTATKGTASITATLSVTIFASEEEYNNLINGGTQGTTTTTVTLNDYEPHEWAYYNKEMGSPIRSWNPANVKITYEGEGKMYTSTTATPSGDLSNVVSGSVMVSSASGEAQHTFIYYKTLERTDGTTANNPTGRCEYRTIPNPFTVRPTFTLTGTKYYTGFYKWRIKSYTGGRIYAASSGGDSLRVGGTIDADQTIYFAPTSEYGMTVEFEAVWARAYVATGTTNLSSGNYVTGTNAHERNFHVLTSSTTASNVQKSYALTVSARYPDGSNGGGSLTGGFTAAANTKFENITISASSNTYNAGCHDLVIGRGCSGSTISIVQGLGDNQTSDVSYSIRLESGTIVSFWPTRKDATTFSGKLSTLSTIGCDYDRASGTNTLLHIMPNVSSGTNTYFIEGGGGANTFNGSGNRNNIAYDWIVKSGKIQENVSINTADPFYLGNYVSSQDANSVKYIGKRRLTVEGGEMGTVAAGIGPYGTNYSNYTVDDGSWTVLIRLKGGTVNGAIYGAGVYTGSSGDRLFIFTGGTVKGWVAGGCNGTQNTGGELYGETFIYVGGKTQLDGTAATVGSSNGGHIFGAGSGINGGTTVGRVNSSTVVVADEAEIARNVYGGGNYGYVREGTGNKSDIYILGGTVSGSVFGGSNQQQGQIVNINMKGGTVVGGVYGGSNASGTVAGPVSVNILGGTVGASSINPTNSETGHVFGSGYGSGTSISGNVTVTIGATGSSHSNSPLIYGNVYGGGHNAAYTSNNNTFWVKGYNGLVKGSIFGGGKGTSAIVTGDTDVQLQGYISVEGNVFGGGDAATVTGNTKVTIQD